MIDKILKTIEKVDGRRRVQIFRSDTGLYGFGEDEKIADYDGNPAWAPITFSGVYDSEATAAKEACAKIDWLKTHT